MKILIAAIVVLIVFVILYFSGALEIISLIVNVSKTNMQMMFWTEKLEKLLQNKFDKDTKDIKEKTREYVKDINIKYKNTFIESITVLEKYSNINLERPVNLGKRWRIRYRVGYGKIFYMKVSKENFNYEITYNIIYKALSLEVKKKSIIISDNDLSKIVDFLVIWYNG